MTAQLEFVDLNDQEKLCEIYKKLSKIEKKENGVYKILDEIKKERIVLSTEIEHLVHDQIYGILD